MKLVRGRFDEHPQAEPVGELLEPHARVGVAADEAEVVVREPEHGRVVDHAARLVADRRVDHLADRQLAHVARHRPLDQGLGVGAEHLPLAQRGEVHDHALLARRPVLRDRALVVEAVRQPVAAVLHEALRELARPRVERRLLRQHSLRVRGHAVGDRGLERVLRRVDAHVDVRDLPPVRGIDVVRARRRRADEIREGAHQDVVAGARPGLVRDQHVVAVEAGVEEEVHRLPARPLRDSVRRHLVVEVLRAGDVARVAEVVVVLLRAGEPERVVATDRVLHDLHERVHVDVEELRVQPGLRIGRAHQGARGHPVHPALEAALQLVLVEREEVRALLAPHVDDLDVLALLHLVGERGSLVDAEVEPRLRQRRRQLRLHLRPRRGALKLDDQRRRRRLTVDHPPARRRHHQQRVALGRERLRVARPAVRTEQPHGHRVVGLHPARVELRQEPVPTAPQHGRRGVRPRAQGGRVVPPLGREHGQLGRLAAVGVHHPHAVARAHLHHRRGARAHPPRLERAIDRLQASHQRWRGDRHGGQAFAAGSRDSSLSACSISCCASSRLAEESSFLTSFSTTRRL